MRDTPSGALARSISLSATARAICRASDGPSSPRRAWSRIAWRRSVVRPDCAASMADEAHPEPIAGSAIARITRTQRSQKGEQERMTILQKRATCERQPLTSETDARRGDKGVSAAEVLMHAFGAH